MLARRAPGLRRRDERCGSAPILLPRVLGISLLLCEVGKLVVGACGLLIGERGALIAGDRRLVRHGRCLGLGQALGRLARSFDRLANRLAQLRQPGLHHLPVPGSRVGALRGAIGGLQCVMRDALSVGDHLRVGRNQAAGFAESAERR